MAPVKIPLFQKTYRNVDKVELSDANARLICGYKDEAQGITSFPGLAEFTDLASSSNAVDGLYWWDEEDVAIGVTNGAVYKIEWDGASVTKTLLSGATLPADVRVSFDTDGTYVFMAAGGRIVYTDGLTTSYMGDVDAPSAVDDVNYLDTYILANESGTGRWSYSEVQDGTNWNALDFANAVGQPDNVIAQRVFQREIYLFGKKSTEIWENDGSNPFSRTPGGFLEIGCGAKKSIVKDETGIYWLSDQKKFVRMSGGGPQHLPTGFDKVLREMSTVSDCLADIVNIEGKTFLLFSFPSGNLTLLYNIGTEDWSELGYWRSDSGTYDRWLGNNVIYCKAWNITLVGSRNSSQVFKLSTDVTTDDGNPIRLYWESGHNSFGTNQRKRGSRIKMRAKRGHVVGAEPTLTISWTDDNHYASPEYPVSLGESGETNILLELPSMGIFYTRQYKAFSTDAAKIIFQDAEEDLEVLR